ncbi:DUF1566 domain-containing protein [Deltaproteobacteria bacterium TL4]
MKNALILSFVLMILFSACGKVDEDLPPEYMVPVPVNNAVSIAFSDKDPTSSGIAGVVTVAKALDESDLTDYVLYWGSEPSTQLTGQTAITTWEKTGNDLTYTFAESTAKPSGATHLLVYSKNIKGYESATPVAVVISDLAPMITTDIGDGTIWEPVTGLMWQKEDDHITRNWSDAGAYCDVLSLGGYSDWRLPDIDELKTLIYESKSPTIDLTYFPNTDSSGYWSSTTDASDASYAWGVGFSGGRVNGYNKTSRCYVRCVRGGL